MPQSAAVIYRSHPYRLTEMVIVLDIPFRCYMGGIVRYVLICYRVKREGGGVERRCSQFKGGFAAERSGWVRKQKLLSPTFSWFTKTNYIIHVYICPRLYLKNQMFKLHQIFDGCCLWLWLNIALVLRHVLPVLWMTSRHVCTQWLGIGDTNYEKWLVSMQHGFARSWIQRNSSSNDSPDSKQHGGDIWCLPSHCIVCLEFTQAANDDDTDGMGGSAHAHKTRNRTTLAGWFWIRERLETLFKFRSLILVQSFSSAPVTQSFHHTLISYARGLHD